MIKIIGIVFCALIINIILKDYSRQFTILINLVCAVIIFFISYDDLKSIIDSVNGISDSVLVISPYISVMMKILSVSLLAQLLADLCRDNGENALANQTELCAKIIILVMAMPLFNTIINIMTGLLK